MMEKLTLPRSCEDFSTRQNWPKSRADMEHSASARATTDQRCALLAQPFRSTLLPRILYFISLCAQREPAS